MKTSALIITIAAVLIPLNSFADIYRYVDDKGVVHFTNIPQPGKEYKRIISEGTRAMPGVYDSIIESTSSKYSVRPSIIRAVITMESNWEPRAVSKKGAMGLMQLMPSTAEDMNIKNPFDPKQNIEGGTRYLRYLLDRFDEDLKLALAAYNAGPSLVEKYGRIPSIPETSKYVKNVIKISNKYARNGPSKIYKIRGADGTVLFTNNPEQYRKFKLSSF